MRIKRWTPSWKNAWPRVWPAQTRRGWRVKASAAADAGNSPTMKWCPNSAVIRIDQRRNCVSVKRVSHQTEFLLRSGNIFFGVSLLYIYNTFFFYLIDSNLTRDPIVSSRGFPPLRWSLWSQPHHFFQAYQILSLRGQPQTRPSQESNPVIRKASITSHGVVKHYNERKCLNIFRNISLHHKSDPTFVYPTEEMTVQRIMDGFRADKDVREDFFFIL